MRILLLEDDVRVANHVAKGLDEAGHVADQIVNGHDGQEAAMTEAYDVIVVDRMLPGIDGLAVVRSIRDAGNRVPVIFLSALSDVEERVKCLRAGGDDYLGKPFSFTELLARIEALARRATDQEEPSALQVDGLRMDLLGRVVSGRSDHRADAARVPSAGIPDAAYRSGRDANDVARRSLDYHFDPRTNVIDVHISRLRKKIDKGHDTPLIHTVRGAGYVLRAGKT